MDDNTEERAPRATISRTAFDPLAGSTPRPWTTREGGECAWPVGHSATGETLSCCLQVAAPIKGRDQRYCPHHRARFSQPMTARVKA